MTRAESLHATKHHGLANDFLVVLTDAEPDGLADLAIAMCDRLVGIGADGLIVGLPSYQGDLRMILHNADGSRAEMSGNGIRCLAQAEVMRRGADAALQIVTDGGIRAVEVTSVGDGLVEASVEMGPLADGPGVVEAILNNPLTRRAATGDLGNPHLVVEVDDPALVDVAAVGTNFESHYPDGINVEFIRAHPTAADTIELAVWERGAGITQACGTGATAAATRAYHWGLVGSRVTVDMPGGSAIVEVPESSEASATLIGPAQFVADVHWPVNQHG